VFFNESPSGNRGAFFFVFTGVYATAVDANFGVPSRKDKTAHILKEYEIAP
jgi:hypothetical protein